MTESKHMSRAWTAVTMPDMNQKTWETQNRDFENFLYAHRIYYRDIRKDESSKMTVWEYAVDNRLVSAISEFNDIVAKGY